MTPKLAPHEVTIDAELALDFIRLGEGDIQLGLRVARAAALDLACGDDPRSPGHDAAILRHLRAAETVAGTAKELLGHVKRYELERRTFLDEVARIGRLHEDAPR